MPSDLNARLSTALGWLSTPDAEHDLQHAMAAYEAIKERGWFMDHALDFGGWGIRLCGHGTHVQGTGDTFQQSLSRAVLAAAERGKR